MSKDFWKTMAAFQKATLAARTRTGDKRVGVEVDCGCFNVVLVIYPKGKKTAKIVKMLKKASQEDALAFLNKLTAKKIATYPGA